jgi:hypothetical protein
VGDEGSARRHLEAALDINPHFSILFSSRARAALETIGSDR